MTARDDEREISSALERMRKAEEASAPPFDATLMSARAGHVSRRSAIGPILTVATLLAVIAGLAVLESKHPPASPPAPAPPSTQASLESWQSPTDFLLDTPGSELWRGLPRLAVPLPANPPTDFPSSRKGAPS